MEENKKGAYLSKVDDFAKEMAEMAASQLSPFRVMVKNLPNWLPS